MVVLRGVIALLNANPLNGSPVLAVMPKDARKPRDSRLDPRIKIPEHHPFVRWHVGDLLSTTFAKQAFKSARDGSTKYAVVFLAEGEYLSIDGADPNQPLDYEMPPAPDEPSSFYWVTSFGRICGKKDYIAPAEAAPLISIERGLLGAAKPMDIWSFSDRKDVPGQEYKTEIAPAVIWRLRPAGKTYKVKFSGGSTLTFNVTGNPIELGNYPFPDAVMDQHHDPKPGDIDPHFELYDDFFKTKHGKKFHKATFVAPVYKARTGPSCAPVTLP